MEDDRTRQLSFMTALNKWFRPLGLLPLEMHEVSAL